jgi:hypothetical protein
MRLLTETGLGRGSMSGFCGDENEPNFHNGIELLEKFNT